LTIQEGNIDESKLSNYLILSIIFFIAGTLIPLIVFLSGILKFLTIYGLFIGPAILGIVGIIMYFIDKEIFYGMFQNKKKLGEVSNKKILKGINIARIIMLIGSAVTIVFFIIDMISIPILLSSL